MRTNIYVLLRIDVHVHYRLSKPKFDFPQSSSSSGKFELHESEKVRCFIFMSSVYELTDLEYVN